ncbi:unnamed protein product (macronuclear) [Paramecium tetraurelia]|uniref:MIF4G domain-containing protein n=1 Tax=Paramecium tetraurelia TaxID=5888 RepID=A0E717_PARTE|nr:uncharacterized protein GSPATT00023812001 [Paramecium tetraurelia]CAK91084.1 unnamed protein product [Paramecium tetraurelia]|eukprot:XP_001458481.1 hypothetical protein (macronuclear) [Paramecium tetraurelia strain d4-2]
MSQNPTSKKGLKLSAPFEPTANPSFAQPYYPPPKYYNEPPYYAQTYVPTSSNQQGMHEQGNTINSLSLNGGNNANLSQSTSANATNGQQPQQNAQKPKKRLVLNSNTQQKFVLDQTVEKKADEEQRKLEEQKKLEEEKLKKEQEQQRLLELRKPKPYSKEELKKLVEAINDFNEYFDKQEWQLLKERKHFNIKELQTKTQPPRKEGKVNTYTKTPNQRPPNKPAAPTVQPFDRAQIQPATETQPKIIIVRVVEDIQTKQLKDRMKTQAEDFFQTLNQTPEQREIIFKELRYRLNQLAPDNFEMASQNIIKVVIDNKSENDSTYLEYLAQKIIEKSQTEPKYRKLYTKLCQLLIKEPQLTIVKEKQDGKAKSVSLFKNQLLNQVQQVFDERKNKKEDLSHMKPEEREQYHLIRKQKIMGNVRFIGDLFLSKVLPILAVEYAIRELISDYVAQYLPNQENSEESIEGLIELLDQIGGSYKTQSITDFDVLKKDLEQFFDGTTKNLEEAKAFLQKKLEKNLSIDIIMEIFNLLISKYKVSQRISMLIENVQERRNQGWKDHYSRQDQAQSVKTIHQEQEKEIIEQNYNQSKNKNKKYQTQQVLYVEKNSSQQSSSASSQQKQQLFDLNELAIFVQGTFNMEPQQQEAKLLEELKRVGPSDEAIQKFFEIFFEQLLSYKLIKQNIERAQMVFELLSKAEAKEEIVKKATQKALNEDKVYDLADSPTAIDLLVDIIGYFLNDSDINSLKKLYFKPEVDIEDFNDFMSKIATQLLIKYSDKENIIKEYYGILGYQI